MSAWQGADPALQVPADYIASKGIKPTPAELAHGYRAGLLGARDLLLLARNAADHRVRQVANAHQGESEVPDHLVSLMGWSDEPPEARVRVWIFLCLSWLWEHREVFDEPLAVIEELFADLDYPEVMYPIVRYMPAAEGAALGEQALRQRWRNLVKVMSVEFAARDAQ